MRRGRGRGPGRGRGRGFGRMGASMAYLPQSAATRSLIRGNSSSSLHQNQEGPPTARIHAPPPRSQFNDMNAPARPRSQSGDFGYPSQHGSDDGTDNHPSLDRMSSHHSSHHSDHRPKSILRNSSHHRTRSISTPPNNRSTPPDSRPRSFSMPRNNRQRSFHNRPKSFSSPHQNRPVSFSRNQSVRIDSLGNSSHHNGPPRGLVRNPSVRSNQNNAIVPYEGDWESSHGSLESVSINFEEKERPVMKRTLSIGGLSLDISLHSMQSARSTASSRPSWKEDKEFFDDDDFTKRTLRYLHILPPYKNEPEDKKWIRIYTWTALVLDFIAAMVSMTTYDGVTTCCGVPIYEVALSGVNWNKFIRVLTYIYFALIFIEVIPVLRSGLPLNMLNPLVGFTIFFAMFFDDRTFEAVCMWVIESSAIICEFLVYRCQSRLYHEKEAIIEKFDKELEVVKAAKSKRWVPPEDSDDDSFAGDNSRDSRRDFDIESAGGSMNPHLREMRILRERRQLRQIQKADRIQLRYHFIGVVVNFTLVAISLTLVIVITRSGGLCMTNFETPNVFASDQAERCNLCDVESGEVCEICTTDIQQCYYPYY